MKKKNQVVAVPLQKKNPENVYKHHLDFSQAQDASELDGSTVRGTITKNNARFRFSFSSEGISCCGIKELQSFEIEANSNIIPESEKVKLVRNMLEKIIEVATDGNQCRTLIFTTINNQPCTLVDKALADSELYTKVKTFTNSNTGRENRLYVSNN